MRLVALVAITGTVIACAAGKSSDVRTEIGAAPTTDVLARRVAGCYVLRPGSWEADTQLTKLFSVDAIPRHLELKSSLLTGWDAIQSDTLPMYAVDTDTVPPRSRWLFNFWQLRRVGGDTIHIGAPLPFAGAYLRVVPAPNGLVGTLTTFTDAIPPDGIADAEAPVFLDRVACGPRAGVRSSAV